MHSGRLKTNLLFKSQMKQFRIIETLQLYVMKAETGRALDELFRLLKEKNIKEYLNQVMILSSSFQEIEKNERLGLGKFIEDKNRINLALIKIIEALENAHLDMLDPDDIPEPEKEIQDRLARMESKLDFILSQIEKQDDYLYLGLKSSVLWKNLEKETQDIITSANILEKEGKLDNYSDVIGMYIEAVRIELQRKIFEPFRDNTKYRESCNNWNKKQLIAEFHGNNKNILFLFLSGAQDSVSIGQMCDILLENVLTIEKTNLKGGGKLFFQHFFETYNLRNKNMVTRMMRKFTGFRIKGYISNFVFTPSDVKNTKKLVFGIFQNFQGKKAREKDHDALNATG